MPEVTRDQRVQLGCGTLILIAIIVMLFSRERYPRARSAASGPRWGVKNPIEQQSAEIRQLRE